MVTRAKLAVGVTVDVMVAVVVIVEQLRTGAHSLQPIFRGLKVDSVLIPAVLLLSLRLARTASRLAGLAPPFPEYVASGKEVWTGTNSHGAATVDLK